MVVDCREDVVEKVEQLWVDGMDFARPVVAQDIVDLLHGFGDVVITYLIGNRESFPGMGLIETQGTFITGEGACSEEEEKEDEARGCHVGRNKSFQIPH
jgi:hypothetical protein